MTQDVPYTIILNAKALSESEAVVSWLCEKQAGLLRIVMPKPHPNMVGIAELTALYHLHQIKQVFGKNRLHGYGLQVFISSGKTRKMLQNIKEKSPDLPFAAFFEMFYVGAKVEVWKKQFPSEMPALDGICDETLEAICNTHFPFVTSKILGTIRVSYHAYQQFVERHAFGTLKKPLKSLATAVGTPELQEVVLPDRVKKVKDRRYSGSPAYHFKHPNSTMIFTMAKDKPEDDWTILTVINRHDYALLRRIPDELTVKSIAS